MADAEDHALVLLAPSNGGDAGSVRDAAAAVVGAAAVLRGAGTRAAPSRAEMEVASLVVLAAAGRLHRLSVERCCPLAASPFDRSSLAT